MSEAPYKFKFQVGGGRGYVIPFYFLFFFIFIFLIAQLCSPLRCMTNNLSPRRMLVVLLEGAL